MPPLLTRAALLALLMSAPACANPVTDRIYPAPQAPLTLDGLPAGSRFVPVTTADGLKLTGIIAPGKADRPLLLLLHGNGSSAATALRLFAPLLDDGYGILAAEYRGYSGHAGKPSEAGLVEDAAAFLAAARTQAAGRPIWIVGYSLGGGVGLALSRRARLDLLVTIGTFTRIRDMAPSLARALVPNEYRNIDAVPMVDEPFYLVHGLRDQIVPWQHGEALHKAAKGRAGGSFLITDGLHHPRGPDLRAIFAAIVDRQAGRSPALPANLRWVAFPTS
jgi:pimeloyl-ACP methyl ester carboxylesterase